MNDFNENSWFKVRVKWVFDERSDVTESEVKGLINVSRFLLTMKYKKGFYAKEIEILRSEHREDYWFL